jgi:hypothetical protein
MVTYTYMAINMPGSEAMTEKLGTWGVLLVVLLGAGIGVGAVLIWQLLDLRKVKPANFSGQG